MKNVENESQKSKKFPTPITSGSRREPPIYPITIPLSVSTGHKWTFKRWPYMGEKPAPSVGPPNWSAGRLLDDKGRPRFLVNKSGLSLPCSLRALHNYKFYGQRVDKSQIRVLLFIYADVCSVGKEMPKYLLDITYSSVKLCPQKFFLIRRLSLLNKCGGGGWGSPTPCT